MACTSLKIKKPPDEQEETLCRRYPVRLAALWVVYSIFIVYAGAVMYCLSAIVPSWLKLITSTLPSIRNSTATLKPLLTTSTLRLIGSIQQAFFFCAFVIVSIS